LIDTQLRELIYRRFSGNYAKALNKPTAKGRRIWVHGASVGEVSLALKLIQKWQEKEDVPEFILTTNTLTGLEVARTEPNLISYIAPFDFTGMIQRFIRQTKVTDLILMETEIWPNMIREMGQIGKISFVNGRLSDRHINKYIRYRSFFKSTLSQIFTVIAGDQRSAERFEVIGIPKEKIRFYGNLKFELPPLTARGQLEEIRKKYLIEKDHTLMVAGSIQPEEVAPILEAWNQLKDKIPNLRLFLIPRHPDKRGEFQKILESKKTAYYLATRENFTDDCLQENKVHVIDLMGVLRAWYALSDVAFVGGSLCRRGGQNMLEAVAMKKKVCIGPFATNFQQEVEILQGVDGLKIVNNAKEMAAFIDWTYEESEAAQEMAERGYQAICEHSGALKKNIEILSDIYR